MANVLGTLGASEVDPNQASAKIGIRNMAPAAVEEPESAATRIRRKIASITGAGRGPELAELLAQLKETQPPQQWTAQAHGDVVESVKGNLSNLEKWQGKRDTGALEADLRNGLRQLLDNRVVEMRKLAGDQLKMIYAARWHKSLSRNDFDRCEIVDSVRRLHADLHQAKSASDFRSVFEKITA
jgi:hypothetical protein